MMIRKVHLISIKCTSARHTQLTLERQFPDRMDTQKHICTQGVLRCIPHGREEYIPECCASRNTQLNGGRFVMKSGRFPAKTGGLESLLL